MEKSGCLFSLFESSYRRCSARLAALLALRRMHCRSELQTARGSRDRKVAGRKPWRKRPQRTPSPRPRWWTLFHDDDLQGLETELTFGESDPEISARSLRTGAGFGAATKRLAVSDPAGRSGGRARTLLRQPGDRLDVLPSAGPVTQNSYILPFTVSYEVDLFGKVRRTIEAAQASYQANTADLENVRLILTAELAADYFTLRQLDTEIAIAHPHRAKRCRKGLDLVKSRHSWRPCLRTRCRAGRDAPQHDAHAGDAAAATAQTIRRRYCRTCRQARPRFPFGSAGNRQLNRPNRHRPSLRSARAPPGYRGSRSGRWPSPTRKSASPKPPIILRWFFIGQGGWNSMNISQLTECRKRLLGLRRQCLAGNFYRGRAPRAGAVFRGRLRRGGGKLSRHGPERFPRSAGQHHRPSSA